MHLSQNTYGRMIAGAGGAAGRLSELFGASVDFVLRGGEPSAGDATPAADTARPVTAGMFLCILSPVCLLLLSAVSGAA